jgi:regulatory protein
MKIEKIKKKKSNIYEITLSNKDKVNLYDDVILKYELLIKKDIDDKILKKIIDDNSYLESYYIALKYISIRLRTEKEIRKKLKNYSKSIIDYSINRLKSEGYLNNSLYIKSYINDEINLKLVGYNKILYDLKKLGFNEEEIKEYLDTIDNDIFLDKINNYIEKRINTNHNLSALMLKNKILTDLISKGFNKEDINNILDNYDIKDNEDIYLKEYNKIKNKLGRKYSGEELEYQIRINLYKKGYKKDLE